MNKYYAKYALFVLLWGASPALYSQNIAINNTGNPADPSAGLDVSFTNKGFLPPRMTTSKMNAISSPAAGLQVFDTTTHCLMMYSGNSWQSIYCACISAPATPGSISGSSAVCADTTGKIYSVAVVFGANSYTWNVPAGASITAGQGTPSITVTFGSAAGNITVTATNNCGTSAASSLPVTINTIPASVTASASPNPVCAGNTLTLTGNATGATGWSWTGPNSFSSTSQSPAISNITTAGAGTYTLTAGNVCGSAAPVNTASVMVNTVPTGVTATASPNSVCVGSSINLAGNATGATSWSWTGPNGYTSSLQSPGLTASASASGIYTLTAGNACGTATPVSTTSVTVNVPYVPITISNNQSASTGTNFQQMLTVNSSAFSAYENSGLQNIEFTTGPGGTGNVLQAWIESGNTNNTTTTYWVNLGSNSIAGNSTLTIYMNFMATNVMSSSGPTGEAPQLSGNYGQYDNGANTFPALYQNFAGTNMPSGWRYGKGGSSGIPVNNGVTFGSSDASLVTSASYGLNPNQVLDFYGAAGYTSAGGYGNSGGYFNAGNGWDNYGPFISNDNKDNSSGVSGISCSPNACNVSSYFTNYGSYHVFNIYWPASSSVFFSADYGSTSSVTSSIGSSQQPVGFANQGASSSSIYYWIRLRSYPPGGVMPGVNIGSETCQ